MLFVIVRPLYACVRRRIRLVLIRVREGDGASEGRDPTLLSGLLSIRTHELSEESDDECVDEKVHSSFHSEAVGDVVESSGEQDRENREQEENQDREAKCDWERTGLMMTSAMRTKPTRRRSLINQYEGTLTPSPDRREYSQN